MSQVKMASYDHPSSYGTLALKDIIYVAFFSKNIALTHIKQIALNPHLGLSVCWWLYVQSLRPLPVFSIFSYFAVFCDHHTLLGSVLCSPQRAGFQVETVKNKTKKHR